MADRAEGVAPRVILLLAAAVLLGVGIPYLQLPFAGEHGVYAYGGWRMRQGEVPYRDFWDMNTPAVFALHSIADTLFGHGMRSIRIFDLLWMLATSIFLYRVARRLFGPLAASLAVLLATATYFTLGHQPTAQRDGWCLLPLLMMMDGVAALPATPRGDRGAAVLVGLASAVAFWLKPPFLLPSAICAIALLRRRSAPIAGSLAIAGAAFLAPTALVLLYFWRQHALANLYENVVLFNAQYARERYSIGAQLVGFRRMMLADPTLAVGVVGILVGLRRSRVWPFAVLVLACVIVVIVQGKHFSYQMVPLRVLLCVGSAALIADLWSAQRWQIVARATAVAIIVFAAWTSASAFRAQQFPTIWTSLLRGGATVAREELELAKLLGARTQPGDSVLIWGIGTPGTVHYLSQRRSPTRFTMSYPFSMKHADSPLIERWRQEFLEALRRDPPRAVVVAAGDAWQGLKNLDSSVSFSRFTALRDFVTQHYRLGAHMKGRLDYQIFWRIESAQPAAMTTP